MSDLHVIPLNDFKEHLDTGECWCKPVEIFDASMHEAVWVHNSMDRREHTIEKGVIQ